MSSDGIEPIGVPASLEGTVIPFKYGDLDQLEDLLKRHDGELACIIMEPMRTEPPPPGFLEGVRELADRYSVVLIFDQVSCGLRVALGGAQELTGVTPNVTVLAKAISNGYPMGTVVGKREVMEPASRMFISSAYGDDNIGIAAALAALRELELRQAPAYFARIGADLKKRVAAAAVETGAPASCVGVDAHAGIRFEVDNTEVANKVTTLFIQENAKRGLILSTAFFFNCAHDEAALDLTEGVVRESFAVIARGLEGGGLDELLECDLQEDLFRRMVR